MNAKKVLFLQYNLKLNQFKALKILSALLVESNFTQIEERKTNIWNTQKKKKNIFTSLVLWKSFSTFSHVQDSLTLSLSLSVLFCFLLRFLRIFSNMLILFEWLHYANFRYFLFLLISFFFSYFCSRFLRVRKN